jgi:hypothetical protein
MKLVLPLIFFIALLTACGQTESTDLPQKKEPQPAKMKTETVEKEQATESIAPKTSKMHVELIYTENVGWGYDIYEGESLRIHQPHIPAVQGVHGFDTEAQAKEVANHICAKMNAGISPPTITIDEMRQMGVLKEDI